MDREREAVQSPLQAIVKTNQAWVFNEMCRLLMTVDSAVSRACNQWSTDTVQA